MLLTALVLFFILSSGSVFAAARYGHRYEDIFPLTVFSIIIVVYLCGLCGCLLSSIYIVMGASALCWVATMCTVLRKGTNQLFRNLFTPGFAIVVVWYFLGFYLNAGHTPSVWDDFSHWADIVKAMYFFNDFGTNPACESYFAAYPPARACFEYFFQSINRLLRSGTTFNETLLYSACRTASVAIFATCFNRLDWKKPLPILFSVATGALVPLLTFPDYYYFLYIDGYLAILGGFCLVYPYVIYRKHDGLQLTMMCLSLFCLVLTKDAGLLFAVFAAFSYVLQKMFDLQGAIRSNWRRITAEGCVVCLSVLLGKLSWVIHTVSRHAVDRFAGKVSITEMFFLLFRPSMADPIRSEVLSNYVKAIFTARIPFGDSSTVAISLFFFCMVLFACRVFISVAEQKANTGPQSSRKAMDAVSVLLSTVYLIGLGITYLFKFSPNAALGLPSFDRYVRIIILLVAFTLYIRLNRLVSEKKVDIRCMAAIMVCLTLFSNTGALCRYLIRDDIKVSRAKMKPFIDFADQVNAVITEDHARIFILSQGSNSAEYWIFKYRMRPHIIPVSQWDTRSFGNGPYDSSKTVEQWQAMLIEGGYQYVMIYESNDYLCEHYASLFLEPETINSRTLYRVLEDGTLENVPL